MKCSVCGNVVNNDCIVCLKCGAILNLEEGKCKELSRLWAFVPIVLCLIVIMLMLHVAAGNLSVLRERNEIIEQNAQAVKQAVQETGFEWYEVEGGICLSEYVGNDTIIVIPEMILEQKVIAIGSGIFEYSDIVSVTIPQSVERIENNAFKGCENLSTVVIENGCLEIGNQAFRNCTSLCEITIPSTVVSIGDYCFADNRKLSIVNLEQGSREAAIGNGVFQYSDIEEIRIPGNYIYVGSHSFQYCRDMKKIVWEKSVPGCSEQTLAEWSCPDTSVELHGTSSITNIEGSLNTYDSVIIFAPENSYLLQYAQENEYQYVIEAEVVD